MTSERTVTLDEAIDKSFTPDRELPNVRQYLLRIRDEQSGNITEFEPTNVSFDNPQDEIGRFMSQQEKIVLGFIENPNTIEVPRKTTHGRLRKSGVMRQIRESKLREYKFELAVLRGDIMAPITIIEDERKYRDGRREKYLAGYSISRESLKF